MNPEPTRPVRRRVAMAKKRLPGGKPAPKPQKLASSGGGNGGWMAACLVLVVLIAVLGVCSISR